jgi:hypothetical protein
MPPVPGWLVEGLWVVRKVSGDLYKVTQVSLTLTKLVDQSGSKYSRVRSDYLSKVYFACNYFECDDCRKKPGTLTICDSCLARKVQFDTGPRLNGRRVCDLPRFCRRKFTGGTIPLDPFKELVNLELPLPPTRFEREWVI